jgi:hypothetical protein
MHRTVWRTIIVSLVVLGVAVGCGDDDRGDVVDAYCALGAQLDATQGFPSDEELDRIAEAAPSEIREDLQIVVDAFQDKGEAVFDEENEELTEAIGEVEAYDAANCADLDG